MVGFEHRSAHSRHGETPRNLRATRPSPLRRGVGGVFLIALVFLSFQSFAQRHLIPKPKRVELGKDSVLLYNGMRIFKTEENARSVFLLKQLFDPFVTFSIDTVPFNGRTCGNDETPGIGIAMDTILGKDEYEICVFKRGLSIVSGSEEGLIRAINTFYQVHLQSSRKVSNGIEIPFFKITDSPAFPHRGLLLDCSRHFFSVETVKKYIDLLAFYKMNVLHWHLTEDQGWRIQIDKYPKLTQVGAWRTEKDGSIYGGFYTKEEIREVVAYAASRGIIVIPEIEMPGHSQATLAAYPQLSCTGDTTIKVANDWGVFKEIYCAGNDSVFAFLEDVLTEVMALFPSKYIHIGGDEAPKYRWEHCAKCQKRMADLGLKDEHELQSYFITRIEKFLNENGRELIGWDEILEGGLSPNATVQSWRGMEHGKHAAEMKHDVVMSPTSHCYLDYGLDAIDLEKVYRFNPIPEGLDEEFEQYILGGEVNMWTEHVPNDSVLDSRVFPRLIAMAEVLWSGPGGDYEDFYERLQQHYPILEETGVQFGLETEPVHVSTFLKHGKTFVKIEPGLPDLTIEYSPGDGLAHAYERPFELDQSMNLEVMAYKNNQIYGAVYETELVHHFALGKTDSISAFSPYYTAGGTNGLTDGLTGSLNFRDGRWMGFSGVDADVTLDLSKEQELSSLSFHYYLYPDAWIMQPKQVSVYASINGENWVQIGKEDQFVSTDTGSDKAVCTTQIELKTDSQYRYLRVVIKNFGKLPDNHAAAGSDAWIFVDEIIVR